MVKQRTLDDSLVEEAIVGSVVEIDNNGYIICDKAIKVWMLHCELKWEIPR